MWRGLPQAYAEARALHLAREEAPGSRAVVQGAELHGIDWEVRLWLFASANDDDPQEARVRLRGTDGEPLGFDVRP
jgi:hypothetical protein